MRLIRFHPRIVRSLLGSFVFDNRICDSLDRVLLVIMGHSKVELAHVKRHHIVSPTGIIRPEEDKFHSSDLCADILVFRLMQDGHAIVTMVRCMGLHTLVGSNVYCIRGSKKAVTTQK